MVREKVHFGCNTPVSGIFQGTVIFEVFLIRWGGAHSLENCCVEHFSAENGVIGLGMPPTVESLADLLWQVDRLVQDNPGSRVTSVDDPRRRRIGFMVCCAGSEEMLWVGLQAVQETFQDCAMKLDIVLPSCQDGTEIVQLTKTAAGRRQLALLLQEGLIGPTPRPAPGRTQWERLLNQLVEPLCGLG